MNFNYSYRAFLISCLLVGNLVLILVSVKLSDAPKESETFTPVEYSAENFLEEEEAEEIAISEKVAIETNSAYNEAEQFISDIENSRNEAANNSEENTNANPDESPSATDDLALNDAREKLKAVKEKLSERSKQVRNKTNSATSNTKTTLSYHLKDRKAMELRNPVYTCESGGVVVINIEVNNLGKIVNAYCNSKSSTTTNGCLIDSALEYAKRSRFSTSATRATQLGSITYTFPGQG